MAQPGRHDEVLTRITEVILGARAELTREEAAAAAGTTVEEARRFWRAMGFPDVGGRAAFTSRDVDALRQLMEWIDSGLFDQARALEVVRGLGQSTSRLADWQVSTMARVLSVRMAPGATMLAVTPVPDNSRASETVKLCRAANVAL